MVDFKVLGTVSPGQADAFEAELGFKLPQDYKMFIEKYNGASFRGALYWVPKLNVREDLDILFGILDNRSLDIRFQRKEMIGEIPNDSLVIGYSSGGGLIVLSQEYVAFYDHSYYYRQSSDSGNAYKIAGSFSEFLAMLEEPIRIKRHSFADGMGPSNANETSQ